MTADLMTESEFFGSPLGDHYENFGRLRPRNDVRVFGWIVYRDVMEGTAMHLSEFCRQVKDARLSDDVPKKLAFDFDVCPEHNCSDEYCSDYSEVISYAESKMK